MPIHIGKQALQPQRRSRHPDADDPPPLAWAVRHRCGPEDKTLLQSRSRAAVSRARPEAAPMLMTHWPVSALTCGARPPVEQQVRTAGRHTEITVVVFFTGRAYGRNGRSCNTAGLAAHQRTLHESRQQRRRLWRVLQPPQGCHGGADLLDGRSRQQLLDACRQQRQKLGWPSVQPPKTPQGACNCV